MKQALFILLALTALTAAMVPRQRREEKATPICAKRTPCGWAIYSPKNKSLLEQYVKNDYCKCSENSECRQSEDDSSANALIFRCRPKDESLNDDEPS